MIESVTFAPIRTLGDITIDCPIEETHKDTLAITDHPVEQGASISDHAYKEPAQVTLKAGWSNASEQAAGDEEYIVDIYDQLLDLQASREPFDIITGKRDYSNMLIRDLSTTTDAKTAAVLEIIIDCRQVILVETQTTTVPDSSVHSNAAKTAATQNKGVVQPKPAALGG